MIWTGIETGQFLTNYSNINSHVYAYQIDTYAYARTVVGNINLGILGISIRVKIR